MTGVPHGGAQPDELAVLGLTADAVLDLSANLHPAGPDPSVLAAARGARLDRYPPPDARPLRDAIARTHGLDPATVLVTPGGTAGIHLVARALLRAGDVCGVVVPTFGEYAAAARTVGADVREVWCMPPRFEVDAAQLRSARVTFLCVPDNPTGRDLSSAEVQAIGSRVGGTLVVDAAYEPFADRPPFADGLVAARLDVVVIHSLTKLHAVPGLRLGYLVAAPAIIERLAELQPTWSVDAPAIAAGLVALTQHDQRRVALSTMRESRELMRGVLEAHGLAVAPGAANFLLVEVRDAQRVRSALLPRGLVVRDCSSFGLAEWIRVAVPHAARARDVANAIVEAVAQPRAAAR